MIANKINGLSVLQSELLLAAGVPHGWFDSSLGNTVFRPGNPFNDPEWIDTSSMQKRRSQACKALGLDGSRVVVTTGLLQTDIIQAVDASHAGKEAGPADGYITNTPGLPIALAAADCTQTIIYAPDVNAIAVVHAGGLGTARGVLINAVERLTNDFGADPHLMIAAIGPTVGAEHFIPTLETDSFTLADIADSRPVTKALPDGRLGYNVSASNVRQLQDLGVPKSHIEASTIDTFTHPNWYSYERDKKQDMAVAMRRHGLFVGLPREKDFRSDDTTSKK